MASANLCARILVLLFGIPAFAYGQVVGGTVTDPQGVPVSGVLVEWKAQGGQPLTVWTDREGRYQISGLSPGRYILRALSSDFEPVSVEVEVGQGSIECNLQFTAVRRAQTWIEVVGESSDVLKEVPGSVFLVSKEELRQAEPMDANEVLRRVPGVTLREDSGPVAMRLNVAIRGLNPDRSRQVLMLEDGIPIALAPYGEPEMYYSPQIDRMRRVEVLKGSGQIVHGPQTVGGVINFVTPDPPPALHGDFDISGGQRGFFTANAVFGNSSNDQRFGWLLTGLHKRGDGFRQFFFDIDDIHGKFTWKVNPTHQLALKLGWYGEGSNSTYLGLTTPMFEADPNQNPVPFDFLGVERYFGSVTHTATLGPRAVLSSSFFGYFTQRYWRRQDFDRSDQGRDYVAVVGDPSIPGGAIYLRNSAGNRNREFTVFGGQSNLSYEHGLGGIRNKLDTGVRYIYEKADDQHIDGATFTASTGILRDDEDRFGKAFSFYAQNRFFLTEKLIITPGLRVEHYRYTRHILRQRVNGVPTDVDVRNSDMVTSVIPGLGISYQVHPWVTLFGGVHRGFAPPRTKDAINSDGESLNLDAELSWNYEAGVRFGAHRAFSGEVTFFRLDFQNQIIPGAQSGGATTTLVNAGETLHQGVESSVRMNWHELVGGPVVLFSEVRHMYLGTAEFIRNALFQGNRLPYAPRQTFSFVLGVRKPDGFGFQIDANVVGDQFADNSETITPSADGTVGLIPSYTLWNLTADYTIRYERFRVKPFLSVKNLGNRIYIASRAPQGIQPGLFRQVNGGVRISF
jgi:Fe(3+) dicitrate transport protein